MFEVGVDLAFANAPHRLALAAGDNVIGQVGVEDEGSSHGSLRYEVADCTVKPRG